MRRSRICLLAVLGLAAALLLALPAPGARAHPHVWITFEATVLYDGGKFTGLRHKWTFDEFYAAMAIEGLDKNNDGVYDRDELAELAKVNIEGLKDFAYFTYPVVGGKDVKLGEVRDYYLEYKDKALSLYLTVPFAEPVPVTARDFAFAVQDPVFFIAFLPAKTDPVKFSEGTPKSCKASVGTKAGEEDSDRLAKAFAQLATAVSTAKAVSVICSLD